MRNVFCLIFLALIYQAPAQQLAWAYAVGQQKSATGTAIETDPAGNVYVTGIFGDTVDFDPGPSTYTLEYGSFVSKSDSSGNFIWAKMFRGNTEPVAMAVDHQGNVFITGMLKAVTDFDPSPGGTYTMAPTGNRDIFICKLDAAGNLAWAKQWHSDTYDDAHDIEVDANGHVYATGYYQGNLDADPGPGYFPLSNAFDNVYLIRLDGAGNFVFATSISGSDELLGSTIQLDAAGNMYLSGSWRGGLRYLPGSLYQATSQSNGFDVFILKYNSFFTPLWMRQMGGSSNEYLRASKVDYAGNIYSSGTHIGGVTDLDPGTGTYTVGTSMSHDVFLSKLNSDGNFVWGRHLDGTVGYETVHEIDADAGGVYLAGSFQHTVDFNPGTGTHTLAANSYYNDAFLLKLDTSGAFQYVQAFGGADNDASHGVFIHPAGSIHHTGKFNGIVDLDSGTGTQTVSAGTYDDMFVRKLWQPCVAPPPPVNLTPAAQHTVCTGNPATITASSGGTVTWYSSATGGSVLFTGSQLSLPSLTASTTFYAEAHTCVNSLSRTAITVTVIPQASPVLSVAVSNGTVCPGATVSFSATGASGYTWFPLSMNPASHVPLTTAIYTVTGTNSLGCSDTKTISVSLLPQPAVSALISPTQTCAGDTITLGASGTATAYVWAGQAVSGNSATPFYSSTYTVTGTGANGCTMIDTVTVLVGQLPSFSVMGSSSLCPGQSATVWPQPGGFVAYSYIWSHGVTAFTPFTPAANTVYSVTATSSLNCSATHTYNIYLYTPPTVSAVVIPPVICAGQTVSLSAQGTASSYTWTGQVVAGNIAYPISTSVYYLTGKGPGNCTATAQATVTVNPLPQIQVVPTITTVCQGSTISIHATGTANSYSWSGGILDNIPFTATASTVYSVAATNTVTGCQTSTTSQVLVNMAPQISLYAVSNTVCAGQPVHLLAGGANTYTWSTGAQTTSISTNPLVTTVYSVTGTGSLGCVALNPAVVSIVVNPKPTVSITGNTLVCSGESITLTAGGASQYNWSTGSSGGSIAVTPLNSSTYSVIGFSNLNCADTATIVVSVKPLPMVTINGPTQACAGSPLVLTGSGAGSYAWSGGLSGSTITVSPVATSMFTLTGTDTSGCVNKATHQVVVFPLPVVSAIASTATVCSGMPVILSGSGAMSYAWTGGVSDNQPFSPTVSTVYVVTGTDMNGCKDSAQVSITVMPSPTVTAATSQTLICIGDRVILTAGGAAWFVWNGTVTSPTLASTPSVNTSYTVTGYDNNGCASTATVGVKASHCVGLDEAGGRNFLEIFPNPNGGDFTLRSQLRTMVSVYDSLGRLLSSMEVDSGGQVDIKGLAKGVYYLSARSGDIVLTRKVIVH